MTTLASKVALVTGSARIGRAIAERYEQLGASVVVNYSERHREGTFSVLAQLAAVPCFLAQGQAAAPAGCVHRCARVAHGRTRMIVFPLIRAVGLNAATASSRVETLPMFVRSRPSRTRWTI